MGEKEEKTPNRVEGPPGTLLYAKPGPAQNSWCRRWKSRATKVTDVVIVEKVQDAAAAAATSPKKTLQVSSSSSSQNRLD